jgi:hypothetical protein
LKHSQVFSFRIILNVTFAVMSHPHNIQLIQSC